MRIGPRMKDTEPRLGPPPFSSEWNDAPPPPPERPRRVPVRRTWLPAVLPAWFPSERLISAVLVLVIILSTAAFSSAGHGMRELAAPQVTNAPNIHSMVIGGQPTQTPSGAQIVADASTVATTAPASAVTPTGPAAPPANAGVPSASASASAGGSSAASGSAGGDASGSTAVSAHSSASANGNEPASSGSGSAVARGEGAQTKQDGPFPRDADGNLFPKNRIVAYYGHPDDDPEHNAMGILGMDTIDNTYAKLMDQVAEWQQADPDTNVIPAFEFIATVAQGTPQPDNSWLTDTDPDFIQKYIDFAADHDMLVFLDVQVGARGVHDEVTKLLPLLAEPNVMLAIDPEFAIHGDEVPGEDFGHISADDVNWTLRTLADLSAEKGIPDKVLMVHQFRYDMISDKETIENVPGVELVLHADGHGPPSLKKETYGVVVTQWKDKIHFWAGFKVFYNRDDPDLNKYTDIPNMTPEEILQLDPVPYYISYQ